MINKITSNILPILEYIAAIKEDIRDAIVSRGGNLNGIPFTQWHTVVAGLSFGDDPVPTKPVPVKPVPPPPPLVPVVTPINPVTLPPNYDMATDGLTPISVAFAYGALQFDFTGEIGSVEGKTQWTRYTGPLFIDLAPYIEAKRMAWMDAVDRNPEGVWVSWILWSYSGTGNPPYTPTVGIYTDEARENQITHAVYSDGKFYSFVDVSTYTTQGGNQLRNTVGLIKSGVCAPIVDLDAYRDSEYAVSPNWNEYPMYCYGDIFVMWDGERRNIDCADRCSIITPVEPIEPPVQPAPEPTTREEWISYDMSVLPYIGGAGWPSSVSAAVGIQFVWNGENAAVINWRQDQVGEFSILVRIG